MPPDPPSINKLISTMLFLMIKNTGSITTILAPLILCNCCVCPPLTKILNETLNIHSNLPANAWFTQCCYHVGSGSFTYRYSYPFSGLGRPLQPSLRCMCSLLWTIYTHCDIERAHTSCTHSNYILELMSSLRSNHALCRDTMLLMQMTEHLFLILHEIRVMSRNRTNTFFEGECCQLTNEHCY